MDFKRFQWLILSLCAALLLAGSSAKAGPAGKKAESAAWQALKGSQRTSDLNHFL